MSKTFLTVAVTLNIVVLVFLVGFMSWDANMEAECPGNGYLGVILPSLCVLCAFIIGLATGRVGAPDVSETELEPQLKG